MQEIKLFTNSLLVITGDEERFPFTKINFPPERIISYTYCRDMLSDPDGGKPPEAAVNQLMLTLVTERLRLGFFCAVDIPHISRDITKSLLELCNRNYFNPYLICFSQQENAILTKRFSDLGFTNHFILDEKALFDCSVIIERVPSICDVPPPYDIIGDIHGCREEMEELFKKLGYELCDGIFIHPEGRTPIFIGDITDRGPDSVGTMEIALNMTDAGKALYIPGNHCVKLEKYLNGGEVNIRWGIETTIKELESLEKSQFDSLAARFADLINKSPRHLILDDGKLVVTHAGIKEKMIGREYKRVRRFCLFGASEGNHENGLPKRIDWAAEYKGKPLVVYGHTPVKEPEFRFNTINIDQGCVFGGELTALRYPERETISVKAKKAYYCRLNGKLCLEEI